MNGDKNYDHKDFVEVKSVFGREPFKEWTKVNRFFACGLQAVEIRNSKSEEKLFNEMGDFAKLTFKEASAVDHLNKLKNETDEAIADPSDITEYADCLLCLFGAASKAGFTHEELILAGFDKLDIVKTRDWERLEDGTFQHIKE